MGERVVSRTSEAVWLRYLGRELGGEAPDFARLCAAHPELATELQRLREQWLDNTRAVVGVAPGGASARFERYQLRGELGRGGMGVVHRAWDAELRREIALKVLRVHSQGPLAHATSRFVEEAQILAQLDHPSIVPVHEIGVDSRGLPYFAMKLVSGQNLDQIFSQAWHGRDGWNTTRVLSVMQKVCEAVGHAHAKGVVHRDLKPSNVMVGRQGEVFVMDWGVARVLASSDDSAADGGSFGRSIRTGRSDARGSDLAAVHTAQGDVIGTAAYMSPEQARGDLEHVTARSDVFAVGAMLYHLFARRAPYAQDGASSRELIALVQAGPPPALDDIAAGTPRELVAICDKAMQREPGDRYANSAELANDLRAFLEGRVVGAYETGAWAETNKWMRRNKVLSGALASILLVSVGGAIAFARKAEDERVARLESERNAETARLNEQRAREQELLAEQRARDVLSLSTQQDLDDLIARAEVLWPAHPEMLPAYEEWLSAARVVLEGQAADPARGVRARPSLGDHKANLAQLRSRAREATPEQLRADRNSHPRLAELHSKQRELTWCSRMVGVEPWPDEELLERELERADLSSHAGDLLHLVGTLGDPERPIFGEEMRALLLARRAVQLADVETKPGAREALAWCLVRVGRFDEALEEARTAQSERAFRSLMASTGTQLPREPGYRPFNRFERPNGIEAELQEVVWTWSENSRAACHERRRLLLDEVAQLEQAIALRRTFEFDDPDDAWWNRQLSKLVDDLETFGDARRGLMGDALTPEFGWGISKRYEFARAIETESVSGADAARRWTEAITAIAASPLYAGLVLEPQLGLVPIGADPHSQLWEFVHLQTGPPPLRGPDGQLELTAETGLVLVLIPGGTFWMGAQWTEPKGQNFDPDSSGREYPLHQVSLSPYFLSKYEMTQGQWLRLTGSNPSDHEQIEIGYSYLHPVEQVSWFEAETTLARVGLILPSEAQWEYAARAGTSTVWWTGSERESTRGVINIADRSARRQGSTGVELDSWPDLDDGSPLHCEVGRYPANPFGLHEILGNVYEWCLDGWGFYAQHTPLDPVLPSDGVDSRATRGGCFHSAVKDTRSAHRGANAAEYRSGAQGVRPARKIER